MTSRTLSRFGTAVAASVMLMTTACAPPAAPSPDPSTEPALPDGTEPTYEGPGQDGDIPLPPVSDAPAETITPDANTTVVVDTTCCTTTLSVDDATADETNPRLVGNRPPLNVEGGVALAHTGTRWEVTVCLPVNEAIEYRFEFGTEPNIEGRYSQNAPTAKDDEGATRNLYGPVASCL